MNKLFRQIPCCIIRRMCDPWSWATIKKQGTWSTQTQSNPLPALPANSRDTQDRKEVGWCSWKCHFLQIRRREGQQWKSKVELPRVKFLRTGHQFVEQWTHSHTVDSLEEILYGQNPKQHVVFINSGHLDGTYPCLLVRLSLELVLGSVWPITEYLEVTHAVYLAGIL